MKIYISVDMEGLAGITDFSQEKEDSVRFRKAMNDQVAWVIEGIHSCEKNEEIEKITIADSHGKGTNLSWDELSELDDRVYLISGTPRPQYMMPDFNSEYDMVFFVGYHAGIGMIGANMDHTYSLTSVHNFWINGKPMNESTINAAYASYFGVPVTLVIGDSGLKKQLQDEEMMPWVNYVCTKESLSRFAAVFKPKNILKQETIETVAKTIDEFLEEDEPLYIIESPYKLRVEFNYGLQAEIASLIPNAIQIDSRTLELEFDDYKSLFDGIMSLCYCTKFTF
ncbi:MAG TPA: M55 family metallopeptidase [Clostridia bacterium]|nr:M55 family metallopeptidase [Clostridia bacterium]